MRFDKAACGLTLNGIAQGDVTDRVETLLRWHGFVNLLIDIGEIAAIGPEPRRVGVATPGGDIANRITLQDRAVATSARVGTLLVPAKNWVTFLTPARKQLA